MEFIFYNEIVSYIDDNNFIKNFSLISKNEFLKKRRKKINHLNVKNNLNDRILNFSDNYLNYVYNFSEDLDIIFDNLRSLKKKLLDERVDIEDISHPYYPRHSKILVDKFSTSKFLDIIENNTIDDDFNYSEWFSNNNTEIKVKELICPIYRMSLMDREILLHNFPYAKALIY